MDDRPAPPTASQHMGPITSLAEPTRRAVYDFVARAGNWVSRDQAAAGTGLERGTAAHHLDRLADDGLLEVDYRRLSGRRGPGAGRPAKLYRRARRDFELSLPPRDYELAGRLLADAADRAQREGVDITLAIDGVTRDEGRQLAAEVQARLDQAGGHGAEARRRALLDVLDEHGFEPRTLDDGTVALGNCPFHHLAQRHTELICGMNLGLLHAAVADVGGTGFRARLEPEDGYCCVRFHPGS